MRCFHSIGTEAPLSFIFYHDFLFICWIFEMDNRMPTNRASSLPVCHISSSSELIDSSMWAAFLFTCFPYWAVRTHIYWKDIAKPTFSDTVKGTEACAVFCTLAAAATANGISAEQYYSKLLTYPIKILLSWNWCSLFSTAFGRLIFCRNAGVLSAYRT